MEKNLLFLALAFLSIQSVAEELGSIDEILNPCVNTDYYKSHKKECDLRAKQDAESQAKEEADSKAREKAKAEDLRKNGVRAKDICKKDGGSRFGRAALMDPLSASKKPSKDSEGLPILVSSLRKSELKAVYSEVLDQYYPYELAMAGTLTENSACEKRAHVIGCDLKNDCDIMTGKVFVESESGYFPINLGPNGSANWKAHVANVIYEEDENGNTNLVVIDPLLNKALGRKGPIPYKEWFDTISAKGKNKLKTTFSYPGQKLPGSRYEKDNHAKANCMSPKNEMIDIHTRGVKASSPGGGAAR